MKNLTVIKKHDHIIITDTEEVIEFSAPQIIEMREYIEDKFNVTVLHHSLYFYAKKNS